MEVPTSKIYPSNSDASNPVGTEYIIMEKLVRSPAFDIWDDLLESQGQRGYPGRSAPHDYHRAAIRISGISLFVISWTIRSQPNRKSEMLQSH